MTKIKYIIFLYLLSFYNNIFAFDAWILWGAWTSSWELQEKIRQWNIHIDDIPWILRYAIDYLMWFAWTVAVIFIILWAYKIALWWISNDKSKWKDMIILALSGFALASLSWVILKIVIDNFA